jgi:hypothetical protein
MHYALREDRYPIETAEQIKIASVYFTDNLARFSPSDRVEIAANMEKRADELNIELDKDWIINYSRMMKKTASYSPEFESNMKRRKEMCNVYNIEFEVGDKMVKAAELVDKLVFEKNQTEPLQMVAAIGELDKLAKLEYHYDNRIMDPIYTVYGSGNNPDFDLEKIACSLTAKDIKKAVKNTKFMKKISSLMGEKFASDFQTTPVDIFKSLPHPEQQLIGEQISTLEK